MSQPLANDLEYVLERTLPVWDELKQARVFISGGTGFFGCWLLETFAWAQARLKLNTSLVVLTRDPNAFQRKCPHLSAHPQIEFYRGDVQDFIFPKGEFSHVIHAATEASAKLNQEAPLEMFDVILKGTRRMLDFAQAAQTQKFLLTSSGAIYGKQPALLTHISEEYTGAPSPLDTNSAYGMGKRSAEHLCVLYSKQFEVKLARCFAFVGPYLPLDVHFAIGNFIRDGLNGNTITIKGDGTPYRSYLYAADLAIWLWTILCQGKNARPYNVGSDNDITIAQLAQCVANTFQPKTNVVIEKTPRVDQPIERYVPSVDRARNELGLVCGVPLEEAIEKTKAWGEKR